MTDVDAILIRSSLSSFAILCVKYSRCLLRTSSSCFSRSISCSIDDFRDQIQITWMGQHIELQTWHVTAFTQSWTPHQIKRWPNSSSNSRWYNVVSVCKSCFDTCSQHDYFNFTLDINTSTLPITLSLSHLLLPNWYQSSWMMVTTINHFKKLFIKRKLEIKWA